MLLFICCCFQIIHKLFMGMLQSFAEKFQNCFVEAPPLPFH